MDKQIKRNNEIIKLLNNFDKKTIIEALAGMLCGMEMAGENLETFFEVLQFEDNKNKGYGNYSITSVNLEQMSKVAESKEYKDLFLELDKIKSKLKTGQDIADEIQKRTNLPRDESVRLMASYLLRKNGNN